MLTAIHEDGRETLYDLIDMKPKTSETVLNLGRKPLRNGETHTASTNSISSPEQDSQGPGTMYSERPNCKKK